MARPRGILPILAGALAAVLVVVAAWSLFGDGGLPRRGQHVLTLGIALAPDATGTVVEVVGETADASLPPRLDLELTGVDDAALVEGGPSTGGRLLYSDVQDGLGNVFPAEQVRAARLVDVGTDGRRLRLAFHVAAVEGKRVVYPIPRSPEISWVLARLYVQGGTVRCWGDAPSGDSAFGPCVTPAPTEIDGTRHDDVRLELTAPAGR